MSERYDPIPDVFPVLRTATLLLREVEPHDAKRWFARNSDPEVIFPAGGDLMTSIDEAHAAIESVRTAFREKTKLRWAIVPAGDAAAIGSVGLNEFYPRDARAELGYGMGRDWWGRGIMTSATAACIDYAFHALPLNRIEASVVDDNERSLRVLDKLGFQREGLAREYKPVDGRLRDFWLLALLRADWLARQVPGSADRHAAT